MGYKTTKRSSIEESPFRLDFCLQVILPIELELPNIRVQSHDETINEIRLRAQLDVMGEMNEEVQRRVAAYQHQAKRYYNKKINSRVFLLGDLVYRKLKATRPSVALGDLASNWEDPFKVSEAIRNGAYRLETLGGEPIPKT